MLQISKVDELRNIQCFTQNRSPLEQNVVVVHSSLLRCHEEYDVAKCHRLSKQFEQEPYLWAPIIVERDHGTILDGHHRCAAVGFVFSDAYIPTLVLGDYQINPSIKVLAWDTGEPFCRKEVTSAGMTGHLLRKKTTRHIFGAQIEDWHREKKMKFPILKSS